MANWQDLFQGSMYAAKDFPHKEFKGKITQMEVITVKDTNSKEDVPRLCMHFAELDLPVNLNKTNARRLGDKYGNDYTKWKGRTVQVKVIDTTFGGNAVKGLEVTPLK